MVNNKSKSLISVNIDFVEKINKKFVYLFNFLKLFQVALKKKGILISNFSLKTEYNPDCNRRKEKHQFYLIVSSLRIP